MKIKSPLFIVKAFSLSIFLSCSSFALAEDEPKDNSKLVTVEEVKKESITPVVWLPGNVTSRLKVNLSAEQSGKLLWVLDMGSQVKKGQSIASIDVSELEFQLAERESQLKQQQANTVYLKKQQKRLSALLNNNSTARIELDRTERDLSVAKGALNNLSIQIKRIQLAIDKGTIKAPFDGKINQRLAEQGEFVSVGSPLLEMVDPNSLDISIAAPLSVAPFLNLKEEMVVRWGQELRSLPIRAWSPAGDQVSRTFEVRLDATGLDLMSGNAVSVSLPKAKANMSTMVPRDALILRERNTFVMTVDQENSAHKIDVNVGRGLGNWISITGEITAGDKVVVRGGESLQEGQKVRFNDSLVSTASEIIAAN